MSGTRGSMADRVMLNVVNRQSFGSVIAPTSPLLMKAPSPDSRSALRPSCDAPHRQPVTIANDTSSLAIKARELNWCAADVEAWRTPKFEQQDTSALAWKPCADWGLISICRIVRPNTSRQAATRSRG